MFYHIETFDKHIGIVWGVDIYSLTSSTDQLPEFCKIRVCNSYTYYENHDKLFNQNMKTSYQIKMIQ